MTEDENNFDHEEEKEEYIEPEKHEPVGNEPEV